MQFLQKVQIRYILPIFILIIFSLLFTRISQAGNTQTLKENEFVQKIEKFGVKFEMSDQNLDVFIDQDKILHEVPLLQKLEFINPKFTTSTIQAMPVIISVSVGLPITGLIIRNIYENNTSINILHINAFLLSLDEYGNILKQICYSFTFNRDIYGKINWHNFDPTNVAKLSDDFAFSEWCTKKMLTEESAMSSKPK